MVRIKELPIKSEQNHWNGIGVLYRREWKILKEKRVVFPHCAKREYLQHRFIISILLVVEILPLLDLYILYVCGSLN